MRPIKFRGKRTDDNEWIEGDLARMGTGGFGIHVIEFETEFSTAFREKTYPVFQNTVGQFTGLQDKNGVQIFEGDIYRNRGGYERVIYYSIVDAQFKGRSLEKNYFGEYDSDHRIHDVDKFEVEVIGNIHDTPGEEGE